MRECLKCGKDTPDTPCPYCGGDSFKINKKYKIIYADPPWKYRQGKSMGTNFQGAADAQYPCMDYKDICKLDVGGG